MQKQTQSCWCSWDLSSTGLFNIPFCCHCPPGMLSLPLLPSQETKPVKTADLGLTACKTASQVSLSFTQSACDTLHYIEAHLRHTLIIQAHWCMLDTQLHRNLRQVVRDFQDSLGNLVRPYQKVIKMTVNVTQWQDWSSLSST